MRLPRRSELDALRGVLLCIMAGTHLPTRLRSYTDQPLGFVSAAEGFVFLSAFVVGSKYSPELAERGARYVRDRLWARALRVYTYHLALLAFAFTIGAAVAVTTGRPGLANLLAFYFESPGVAWLSGSLLLYQPPLFDILPMYIIFLALSPLVLELAATRGWCAIAAVALVGWVFAQAGGRSLLHQLASSASGVRLPLDALGAFDLLAWQLLWVAGLCVGARHARGALGVPSRLVVGLAASIVLVSIAWRHRIGGFSIELGSEVWLDKWHLGPLRILNFAALAVVVVHALLPVLCRIGARLFSLLGRASLEVFTVHLLLCLVSLAIVADDGTQSSLEEAVVVCLTFAAMLLVAWRASGKRQAVPQPSTS